MAHTHCFFKKLFQTSHKKSLAITPIINATKIRDIDKADLGNPSTEKEVWDIIFSFHPYKALGPDGMHPLFT